MLIRCTQADHNNEQIRKVCIDRECKMQRLICIECLHHNVHYLHKGNVIELTDFEEWIQQKKLLIENVKYSLSQWKCQTDYLFNLLDRFHNLGLSETDSLIKRLCQIESYEKTLFIQLNQSIEQIELKGSKTQANLQQNEQMLNQFSFELLNENSIKQDELCSAIDFNQDSSIVAAGCNKDIKIFQFNQEKLNQKQLLSAHKNDVYTLNFMRKTRLVSGSVDYSIIVWEQFENYEWYCSQILNEHSGWILCLSMKQNYDLIISGSLDKTIKFWVKSEQWKCQQTLSNQTDWIYSLSLNEQQNKLISCLRSSQILIIEQSQQNQQWRVQQKIIVEQYGRRLCFINDHQFTFQSFCKEQMDLYELDNHTQEYKRTKGIDVKCGSSDDDYLFPQQYIKSKNLLVNKNGKNVNFLRIINGDFKIQKSIEFDNDFIYGKLSENGNYLITWDQGSKMIQIRTLQEK